MRRSGALAVVAVVLPLGGACAAAEEPGADDAARPPGVVRAETSEERRLLEAVRRYRDAFLTGDHRTVVRLRNDLCRELSVEEGLQTQVERAAEEYGEPQPLRSFRAEVRRDAAYVTYTFSDEDLDQRRELWTRTEGPWRYGDC